MRMPRFSEPVLRRGFRPYRGIGWKQSPAVSISQDTPEELPADEADIVLEADEGDIIPEEEMELSPELIESEFDSFGEAPEEGTVELTQ